jgi:hypothetical protein
MGAALRNGSLQRSTRHMIRLVEGLWLAVIPFSIKGLAGEASLAASSASIPAPLT